MQMSKFVSEFQHIRVKTLNKASKGNKDAIKDIIKQRSAVLSEVMDCNIHTAREIIVRDAKFVDVYDHDFQLNAKFCSKHLKLSHIIEYPCLLNLQPSILQHRYFSLKELGFYTIIPNFILRFSYILKETPDSLKKKGISINCGHKSDILKDYLDKCNRTEVTQKIQDMYHDGSNLQNIRAVMNAEYLSSKLECSIKRANHLLQRHAVLRGQSILITDELLSFLQLRLGLSLSKISDTKTVHLLSEHHETIGNFLSVMTEILGLDTIQIIQKYPLLLKQRIHTVQQLESTLREFNVSKDQLLCCPRVLSMTPETLYNRLVFVLKNEELANLHSNIRFLWLVYYFRNINFRLKRLKDGKIPCTVRMFTVSKDSFERMMVYNTNRTNIKEAFVYLADIFKMTEKEIHERLNHHSSYRMDLQHFSNLNCQRIIEFLLLSGISREQIFNGLEIVFYDAETVKFHFKNLKNHHACQPFEEWLSHYNLIQLLIYTIEVVDYHCYQNVSIGQDHDIESFSLQ